MKVSFCNGLEGCSRLTECNAGEERCFAKASDESNEAKTDTRSSCRHADCADTPPDHHARKEKTGAHFG